MCLSVRVALTPLMRKRRAWQTRRAAAPEAVGSGPFPQPAEPRLSRQSGRL